MNFFVFIYLWIFQEESKAFFICDFDAKHFADLVEANKSLEVSFHHFSKNISYHGSGW